MRKAQGIRIKEMWARKHAGNNGKPPSPTIQAVIINGKKFVSIESINAIIATI